MSNIIFKKSNSVLKHMAEKHIKLYNKSVVLWKLYMEKFQLKKGRNFVIFFLFRKAHVHLLKIVKNYAYLLNLS